MKKTFILSLVFLTIFGISKTFSQETATSSENFTWKQESNKGKMFFYWGWNWADYSNSDITFKGENYNFTLSDVVANDRPTKFSFRDYFNPGRITIPQTNLRIGYYFHNNYSISFGVDHMKYVMKNGQDVKINGSIATNEGFDGNYNNQTINLSEDFLKLEHTDGLNYVNFELRRHDDISDFIGLTSKNFQLNTMLGAGLGILYPRTNTTLMGRERYDNFHISGWGTGIAAGLNITFLKYFFLQTEIKGGYINMQNIRTTKSKADSAAQDFFYFERMFVFGARFHVFGEKHKK